MPTKQGAHLGGCRNLEDLRGRCVIDDETGCWHKRQADGKRVQYRPKQIPKIFVHGIGPMSARRAAWMWAHDQKVDKGHVVTYKCMSHDCVNPAHLVAVTPAKLGEIVAANGKSKTARKTANARKLARSRGTVQLSEELAAWIRESSQPQKEKAHALDVHQQRISDVERGRTWRASVLPSASVFAWRPQSC
jgi:predicted XRE-type DNA-binding protein